MSEGRLTVSLGSGALPADGVYATDVIDTASGRAVTIPVTPGGPRSVSAPEGTYLVRTTLPSGELLTGVAEVVADQETEVTVATGSVAPRTKGAGRPAVSVWLRLHDVVSHQDRAQPQPWPDGTDFGVGPAGQTQIRVRAGAGLHALQVGGREVPWRVLRLPPSDSCRITVELTSGTGGFDQGVRVRAWGDDPRVESVLRYLAGGQLDRARALAGPLDAERGGRVPDTAEAAAVAGLLLLTSRGGAGGLLGGPAPPTGFPGCPTCTSCTPACSPASGGPPPADWPAASCSRRTGPACRTTPPPCGCCSTVFGWPRPRNPGTRRSRPRWPA